MKINIGINTVFNNGFSLEGGNYSIIVKVFGLRLGMKIKYETSMQEI
jgi:hypothetical protein